MIEGLWTAIFSSGPLAGGGVIYLADGEIVGGDAQYFYKGSYSFDSAKNELAATVKVNAFVAGAISIFGFPVTTFELLLTGNINGNQATITGSTSNLPNVKITIRLVKRLEKISRSSENF